MIYAGVISVDNRTEFAICSAMTVRNKKPQGLRSLRVCSHRQPEEVGEHQHLLTVQTHFMKSTSTWQEIFKIICHICR